MTDYLTEQEQIEVLKNWIKQYALVIVAGVVLALLCIGGWRYWQQRQAKILSHASSVYDEMLMKRAQNDATATTVQAHKLYGHYSKTVYGEMAALMQAREATAKKDYAAAEKSLNWVLDKSHVASFRQIARLRLARLLIHQQKATDAIKLLEKMDDKYFSGLINEVKGDAYLSMNNTPMAREAYKKALTELPNAEVIRPLLQMKYDNLAIDETITH